MSGSQLKGRATVRQILIVEDEEPIREMIAFALRRAGFEVSTAVDSHRAGVLVPDRRPTLALIYCTLPTWPGLALARPIKREPHTRDLPVIMLTARAAQSDKMAGVDGGADDYVTT